MTDLSGTVFLPNTPDDRAGLIVVFAATGICWSLTVLVARLCGSLVRRQELGFGDWAVVVLTFVGITCSTATLVAVREGLGQSQVLRNHSHDTSIAKALYASDLLYLLTAGLSKLATLQLIGALSPHHRHRQVCYGSAALVACWMTAAILSIALRCNTSAPATDITSIQCPSLDTRWDTVEAFSILIEILIFMIAAWMICTLQMSKDKKTAALIIFAVRLPVVIPIGVRLHYLNDALKSSDYYLDVFSAVLATQCALHYSVMSASFFYLKPFLAAFNSNLGASTKLESDATIPLSERRKARLETSRGRLENKTLVQTTPATEAERERERLKRQSSLGSDAPIIMKTQSYQVDVEDW